MHGSEENIPSGSVDAVTDFLRDDTGTLRVAFVGVMTLDRELPPREALLRWLRWTWEATAEATRGSVDLTATD